MLNNVMVEEITLNFTKFTLVKFPVTIDGKEQTMQVSLSGHNHSDDKIARAVNSKNKGM